MTFAIPSTLGTQLSSARPDGMPVDLADLLVPVLTDTPLLLLAVDGFRPSMHAPPAAL